MNNIQRHISQNPKQTKTKGAKNENSTRNAINKNVKIKDHASRINLEPLDIKMALGGLKCSTHHFPIRATQGNLDATLGLGF